MGRRLPPGEIAALIDARERAGQLGALVEELAPLLTEARRSQIEAVLSARVGSVAVAVENPYDPHNAAAVVRSAEALGLHQVHVLNQSERVLRSKRLTTGTHHWIDLHTYRGGKPVDGSDFRDPEPALDAFFGRMHRLGMRVAGACVDGEHRLEELPVDQPICLMMGNEHSGLSDGAKSRCDLRFRVPMTGMAESLNLSVCAAISMYATIKRRREVLGRSGDLDEATLVRARARGYLNSVDARTVRGLVSRDGAAERRHG